jgi:uncharacterized protein YraI
MGSIHRSRFWFSASLLVFSAAAAAQNAMTTDSADLYAGPDDSYPVVAQLDSNTPLQVMGCLDDWSWCDVAVDDARGWLFAPVITYRYEGDYVPLYTYAPSLGIAIVPFSVDVYWDRYYRDRPWFSRREEWAHRTVHHRRPEGPPPSAGPPPRRDDRSREAGRPDERPLHLGSAEPPRREEPPRGGHNVRPEERNGRPEPNPRPELNAGPEPNARPQPNARPEPRPEPRPGPRPEQHSAPPAPAPASPHEDRSPGPGRAAPPPHEERSRAPEPRREDEHPH